MTEQEHLLVINMFARQERFIRVLVDILVSRDVLTKDDMKAFEALLVSKERQTAETLRRVAASYRATMSIVGLDVPEFLSDTSLGIRQS